MAHFCMHKNDTQSLIQYNLYKTATRGWEEEEEKERRKEWRGGTEEQINGRWGAEGQLDPAVSSLMRMEEN